MGEVIESEAIRRAKWKPLTVGQIRALVAALPDEAMVILDWDDGELRDTYAIAYAEQKYMHGFEVGQCSDISYHDNELPHSVPVLVISHDQKIRSGIIEHVGPGTYITAPMKRLADPPGSAQMIVYSGPIAG